MEAEKGSESCRAEGVALLSAALLSMLFMSHHPSVRAVGMAEAVAAFRQVAVASRIVHGVLIALMVVLAWGVLGLARRLGFERTTVRLGAVAYALGTATMVAAATISGFVVAAFAAGLEGVSQARLDASAPLFELCHVSNQAFAQVGVVATAGALLFLSLPLVHRRGAARIVGGYGIVQALAIVAALTGGWLRLDVPGMLSVIVAQALWYAATGVLLIRRAL